MFRDDLIRKLEEVSLGIRKARTRVFEENGLGSGQARVLGALFEYGPLSQADIGRLLDVTGPTVKRQVENLHEAGFVRLAESGSDRRLNIVSLTNKGKRQEDTIKQCNEELVKIVASGMSEPEIIMTGLLLARISENLKLEQDQQND